MYFLLFLVETRRNTFFSFLINFKTDKCLPYNLSFLSMFSKLDNLFQKVIFKKINNTPLHLKDSEIKCCS